MSPRVLLSAVVAATLLLAPSARAAEDVNALKRRAAGGDARAQDALGRYYYEGAGAPDYPEAFKWTRQAAGKGVVEAEARLGRMLLTGLGAPDQDEDGAFQQFLKAARQGHPEASYQVALAYTVGQGVKESEAEAFRWAGVAARKGHPGAQYMLGMMYLKGWCVKSDLRQACGWLLKAGMQGVVPAIEVLADLPDQGESEFTEAMFRQAAQAGSVKAMAGLGLELTQQDDPKARAEGVDWLRKAAAGGDPAMVITLGKVLAGDCPHAEGAYHHAHGCVKGPAPDAAEGARLLLAAAEGPGGQAAYLAVSHLYSEGVGVAKDPAEAYRWIKRAIGSDRYKYPAGAELTWGLGDRFAGIPAADKVYWAKAAAADHHVASYLRLGQAYEQGEGVTADPVEAATWYALAVASHEQEVDAPANAGLKRVMPRLTPAQRAAIGRRVLEADPPNF